MEILDAVRNWRNACRARGVPNKSFFASAAMVDKPNCAIWNQRGGRSSTGSRARRKSESRETVSALGGSGKALSGAEGRELHANSGGKVEFGRTLSAGVLDAVRSQTVGVRNGGAGLSGGGEEETVALSAGAGREDGTVGNIEFAIGSRKRVSRIAAGAGVGESVSGGAVEGGDCWAMKGVLEVVATVTESACGKLAVQRGTAGDVDRAIGADEAKVSVAGGAGVNDSAGGQAVEGGDGGAGQAVQVVTRVADAAEVLGGVIVLAAQSVVGLAGVLEDDEGVRAGQAGVGVGGVLDAVGDRDREAVR